MEQKDREGNGKRAEKGRANEDRRQDRGEREII